MGSKIRALLAATAMTGRLACAAAGASDGSAAAGMESFPDPSGVLEVLSVNGRIDPGSAFFQSLGTNGRSCGSCHVASEAFGLSAAGARQRFERSGGQDPLFAPVDGANCSNVTPGERAGHSLLLQNGLIRVALPLPARRQFAIDVVHDPYGCAIVPDPAGGQPLVSVYRRPLPSANLRFLSSVMFDGRETAAALDQRETFAANLLADLTQQAIDATKGHAQATHRPTDSQLADIVSFELGLFAAQGRQRGAGSLHAAGASGGAAYLAREPYYPGINDSLGKDPTGAPFDPAAMFLFDAWAGTPADDAAATDDAGADARRAIAAGEQIFNTFPIHIANVRGLNDNPALGSPAVLDGHCSSCHDTPNVGNHSLPLPLDIGTSHAALAGMEADPAIAAALARLSAPDLPVYLISGCPDPFNPGQLAAFYTSDPGKALLTGQCSDLGRIKGPILRGLAARAPYFHNGAAANLREVVRFYDLRFDMRLTAEQQADLVAFLDSL